MPDAAGWASGYARVARDVPAGFAAAGPVGSDRVSGLNLPVRRLVERRLVYRPTRPAEAMGEDGGGGYIAHRGATQVPQREVTNVSAGDDVRVASAQFYAALNGMANGDASAMAEVWSHSESVTAMHPIGGREVGWNQVRPVWDQVASVASGGQIALADQLISVAGDMAYEVGVERGQATLAGERIAIEHRVTNVYRREDGAWKVVHHHTDLSPAMVDLLARLQAMA